MRCNATLQGICAKRCGKAKREKRGEKNKRRFDVAPVAVSQQGRPTGWPRPERPRPVVASSDLCLPRSLLSLSRLISLQGSCRAPLHRRPLLPELHCQHDPAPVQSHCNNVLTVDLFDSSGRAAAVVLLATEHIMRIFALGTRLAIYRMRPGDCQCRRLPLPSPCPCNATFPQALPSLCAPSACLPTRQNRATSPWQRFTLVQRRSQSARICSACTAPAIATATAAARRTLERIRGFECAAHFRHLAGVPLSSPSCSFSSSPPSRSSVGPRQYRRNHAVQYRSPRLCAPPSRSWPLGRQSWCNCHWSRRVCLPRTACAVLAGTSSGSRLLVIKSRAGGPLVQSDRPSAQDLSRSSPWGGRHAFPGTSVSGSLRCDANSLPGAPVARCSFASCRLRLQRVLRVALALAARCDTAWDRAMQLRVGGRGKGREKRVC